MSIHNNIHQYRHRSVRDLAWAIAHPAFFSAIQGVTYDWLIADYVDESLWEWLAQHDSDPSALLAHLSQQRSSRLGIYFEQLLSFYFSYHPRFALIAKNVQVNHAKKTIGEYDFIVCDKTTNSYLHIEAAVKFYLGDYNQKHIEAQPHNATDAEASYDWPYWVGPNRRDRLSLKMMHLINRQLCLGSTQAGQECLAQLSIPATHIKTRLRLTGRLYSQRQTHTQGPLHINPALPLHEWAPAAQLEKICCANVRPDQKNCYYVLLPKNLWLSDIQHHDVESYALTPLNQYQLKHAIRDTSPIGGGSHHIAELVLDQHRFSETRRFFIEMEEP